MRSNEERIRLLRERAEALRHRREKNRLVMSGVSTVCLFGCLLLSRLLFLTGAPVSGAVLYTGASLCLTDAGGYVLTAVLSFMAGVGVTAGIRFWLRGRNGTGKQRE